LKCWKQLEWLKLQNYFKSAHKDLEKRSNETKARLENDEATLQQLAAQTCTLLADTLCEKDAIAKIKEQIDALVDNATPLHKEIKKIETQLDTKVTEAKERRRSGSHGSSSLRGPTWMPPFFQQSIH
jgi:DNA repair exonuclease SbcCD ATPase subunit